jgi:predicted DNA-binding transcriptional regulator AlpA
MTAAVVRIHGRDQSEDSLPSGPTLDQVRSWPATVSLTQACRALGISRSFGYELAALDQFPARSLRIGGSVRVLTVSLVKVLSGEDP